MLMLPTNVDRDASEVSHQPDAGHAGERLNGRRSTETRLAKMPIVHHRGGRFGIAESRMDHQFRW